jgi:hypothetical protein
LQVHSASAAVRDTLHPGVHRAPPPVLAPRPRARRPAGSTGQAARPATPAGRSGTSPVRVSKDRSGPTSCWPTPSASSSTPAAATGHYSSPLPAQTRSAIYAVGHRFESCRPIGWAER